MQQEDDLRALAKIMDFMRALSILFVTINIYHRFSCISAYPKAFKAVNPDGMIRALSFSAIALAITSIDGLCILFRL